MKRRDFLKGMAVAGAAASVAGGLGIVPALFTPRTVRAAERNKLVFISDLHMNVDADYSWLVNHALDLASFLDNVNTRDDVAELIILGDMLDDWVSPAEYTPQTFADIIAANYSTGVVPALQEVCDNPNIAVTYVTGNHDMLSFESENKEVIANAFPGMTIISDSPGLGAYSSDNVIWAEHGHRYTLFNAPDIWSRPDGHLPLGYFISRLVASKSVTSGKLYTMPDVLDRFVKLPAQVLRHMQGGSGSNALSREVDGPFDDAFIIAVFTAISRWTGHRAWDRITMDGIDGFITDPFVGAITLIYDTIFSGWPSRQDIVSNYEAVLNDSRLNGVADLLFEMPDRIKDMYPFTPRIILFGHTHQAAFQYNGGEVDTIYANTGTWIDSKPMTWVEVEIKNGGNSERFYTVSLWFYGETSPRHSGTLAV
jgi:UDP-2,3-diacylglucosamine pyrophosphatase LpxH